MNRFFALFMVAAAAVFTGLNGAEIPTVTGIVDADLLNVRLKPGLTKPVVGKVAGNSEVKIIAVKSGWLEIKAPETLTVYVSEARVGRDGVLSGELNMRTAMDVGAPCLGTLPKGAKVETMDERRNGWVRIKVPAAVDIRVYVAAFLVKYDSSKFDADGNIIGTKSAAPAAAEKTEAAPAAPAAAEKTEAAPAAPAAAEKTEAAPAVKEEKAEIEGVLIKWKYAVSKETGYAVLSGAEGFNKGFVFSDDEALLAAHVEKKVRITGKKAGTFGENGVIILKAETITVL